MTVAGRGPSDQSRTFAYPVVGYSQIAVSNVRANFGAKVAELVQDAKADKILRLIRIKLRAYLRGVTTDDLRRSPDMRQSLFGAIDLAR